MDDLVKEYKKSLKILRKAKTVPYILNRMITDIEWVIEYMETGSMPGAKYSISRWSKDKRDVPVDPQNIGKYLRYKEPERSPEWIETIVDIVLRTLTAREREAYELVRGNRFTFTEAAEFMNVTKGTVSNLVQRAEKKIRSKVEEHEKVYAVIVNL